MCLIIVKFKAAFFTLNALNTSILKFLVPRFNFDISFGGGNSHCFETTRSDYCFSIGPEISKLFCGERESPLFNYIEVYDESNKCDYLAMPINYYYFNIAWREDCTKFLLYYIRGDNFYCKSLRSDFDP
jgi:hypothetical protein